VVKEAFHIATTGRPGPVLIDLCKDVQQAQHVPAWPDTVELPGYRPAFAPDLAQLELAAAALSKAERPVILAGHGVLLSHGEEELLAVAERSGTPTGTTLLGIGAFPVRHPLSLHMTGFMGTGWNLKAVQNADLLMMVGMRVDDRVTAKLSEFAPRAETFIHVDIDKSEMGKNVRPHLELVSDSRTALRELLPHLPTANGNRAELLLQIDRRR